MHKIGTYFLIAVGVLVDVIVPDNPPKWWLEMASKERRIIKKAAIIGILVGLTFVPWYGFGGFAVAAFQTFLVMFGVLGYISDLNKPNTTKEPRA